MPNHCLEDHELEGEIGSISFKWTDKGQEKLVENAMLDNVDVKYPKRFTEDLAYDCAKRLGFTTVEILGPPHNFTVRSDTNDTSNDHDHITISLKKHKDRHDKRKNAPSSRKVHIYITGKELSRSNPYKHAYSVREGVKKGNDYDDSLCTGIYMLDDLNAVLGGLEAEQE